MGFGFDEEYGAVCTDHNMVQITIRERYVVEDQASVQQQPRQKLANLVFSGFPRGTFCPSVRPPAVSGTPAFCGNHVLTCHRQLIKLSAGVVGGGLLKGELDLFD